MTPQSPHRAVGPWSLGEALYRSTNWLIHAVTHQQRGTPARLCFLQKSGPLAGKEHLILQSAERASQLEHPGLLPVLDWGEVADGAYVVTASQGHNLQAYIDAAGPLPEVEALRFTQQLARGLSYLHEKELVYQMVEPGSAHLSFDGRAAQLSWPVFCVARGSANHDAEGRIQRVYVPRYAAPEVTDLSTIEPSCDLYGLGQVLFFLLAGYALHQRGSLMETFLSKTEAPSELAVKLPLVTKPTQRLIEALLQPSPSARPQRAEEVALSLQLIAERLG